MEGLVFPNQSAEYVKRREQLLEAEIALKEQREKVAELRRGLPLEPVGEDYVFLEGDPPVERRLSELFEDASKPLVLMHFMYGKKQESPCPMCTMWADGYDGAVRHLAQRVNFAVVVAGDLASFRSYANERSWKNVRLLSSAPSTLKADLGFEHDGAQLPGVSVFTLGKDGAPRHFYSACAMMGGGHFRGMDLLSPVWNFFDLTPEGRGDFMPSKEY